MAINSTTTCVICGATDIPTEGKHLHMCVVRKGRKVLSREWIGWYDGRPITYSSDYNVAYADLNSQVYDILQSDAVITADALADAAEAESTEAPLLVEPHTCAACGDPSDAAICRTCAETGEYCSCGAAATTVWSLNHFCQPVCDACGAALPVGSLAPLADRVPAFAAPVAAPWGCEPWEVAA